MAQVIGQAIDRIDGRAKVTGTAAFAADNRADRMAFGSIVTATIARGRIAGIDTNAARRMPGVLLVMTHENAPRQAPFQAKADDRHARPKPQLASEKVQYFGQPVALVVAETAETARADGCGERAPRRLCHRRRGRRLEVGGNCGHLRVVCFRRPLGHAKAFHDAAHSMLMS